MAFDAPVDIVNRALQLVGARRVSALTANLTTAAEGNFSYDKIRLAALRRNLWTFATRRAVLRAIGVDTLLWTPPTWSATTWSVGQVAAYTPLNGPYSGDTIYWQTTAAKTASNTTTPDSDADWHVYTGPVAVDLYGNNVSSTSTTIASGVSSYHAGEIVIVPATWSGATTYAKNAVVAGSDNNWYVSLTSSNTNHNPTSDTTNWTLWTSGRTKTTWGETSTGTLVPLTYPGTPGFYLSLVDSNTDNPLATGAQWLSLTGTGAALEIVYPLGAGPASDIKTKNVFRLPNGYLRDAPDDPKGDVLPWLGVRRSPMRHDYERESHYIVSSEVGPIMIRFVADVIDVTDFDPLFCEGLAYQIAIDGLVEPLTQAPSKLPRLEAGFKRVMTDARTANAIEMGPIAAPADTYILVRQ